MGSLVVKIDSQTKEKLQNRHHYSDIDMFKYAKQSDGDLPMVYDVEAVKRSIRNILMWRVGESILRPEFGHDIHKSMYEQLNESNKQVVGEQIKQAIENNDSRVKIVSVALKDAEDGEEDNTLKAIVVYKIVGSKVEDAELTAEATIQGK